MAPLAVGSPGTERLGGARDGAITHTIRTQWTSPNGGVDLSGTVSESADAEQNRSLAIAATTADQEFDLDFPYADLKSIYMLASVDMTVETNAADHTGGDEISLVANVPFSWTESSGETNPFTADVTAIFVSPDSAAASTLEIRALYASAA